MKKLAVISLIFAGLIGLKAQAEDQSKESGTVIYEQVMKLNIKLEGEASQIAHALPKERTSHKILRYSPSAALFENHAMDDHEEMAAAGGEVMIRMKEPDNKLFFDLETGRIIEQKEFMSRLFLMEEEAEERKWKMTGAQKEILGFLCFEATSTEEEEVVHAWFTPEISVSAGPGKYGGLPGLILEVTRADGEFRLSATSVEAEAVDPKLLKEPGKGKKVSSDEYQAIVDEKLKEMGVEGGGHGGGHGGAHATFVIKVEQ